RMMGKLSRTVGRGADGKGPVDSRSLTPRQRPTQLFAEAKEWHGLRRFRLRRFWRVNCEALLTATGQNLKRLLSGRGWGRRPCPVEPQWRSPGRRPKWHVWVWSAQLCTGWSLVDHTCDGQHSLPCRHL